MAASPSRLEMSKQTLVYYSMKGDAIVVSFSILKEKSSGTTSLSQEIVRRASTYMQRRHAMLRARLQHDKSIGSSTLTFDDENNIESDRVPIDWDVCESREQMISCFESKLSQPFGFEHMPYLWRVFVAEFVEEGKKMFSVAVWLPMTISDGMNCVTLNIELVNIINALLVGQECNEMKETLVHYGDVYNLVKERELFSEKTKQSLDQMIEERARSGRKEEPTFTLPLEFQSSTESGTRLATIRLSPEKTASLMSNCKQNSQRLTGVFAAVFFYSLKQLYVENNIQHDFGRVVSVNMPISTRIRYTPKLSTSHTGLNVLCPHMSFHGLEFEKEFKNTVWANSEIINKVVERFLDFDKIDPFLPHFDPEDINMLNELLHQAFDKNDIEAAKAVYGMRSCDFSVSNIGRHVAESVKVFNHGPFEISENYFGDSLNSSPLIFGACHVYFQFWNNQILALLSTNSSVISQEYSKRLSELIEANLEILTF